MASSLYVISRGAGNVESAFSTKKFLDRLKVGLKPGEAFPPDFYPFSGMFRAGNDEGEKPPHQSGPGGGTNSDVSG